MGLAVWFWHASWMLLLFAGWLPAWQKGNSRLIWLLLFLQWWSYQLDVSLHHFSLSVGGFFIPLLLTAYFAARNSSLRLWTGAALLCACLFAMRLLIRLEPVFWVIPEPWMAALLLTALSLALLQQEGQRWGAVLLSLCACEVLFTLSQLPYGISLHLGNYPFQQQWWATLYLLGAASATWEFAVSKAKKVLTVRLGNEAKG